MPDATPAAVTVLGLGAMGSALAEALIAAGHPTTVWNRSPGKAAPLVARGATAAATPGEAISASPLVIACLLDNRVVRELFTANAEQARGRTVVNLTNGTPAQARELAALATESRVDYLDGGIMAIPPMIGTPAAFVLYSGSSSAFDTHRAALDRLGEARFVGTDPGMAALQDIALLSGMYGMIMGVLQAFALVGSAGVDATGFAPLLSRWLDSMAGFVGGAAEQIDKGDYTIGVVSNLAMQAVAFGNLFDTAAGQGVSAELIAPLRPLMDRRVADGHGQEDISGVLELLTIQK